jgi:signal transduction histidine kinase
MLSTLSINLAICKNFLPETEALISRGELENITLMSWGTSCQSSRKTWDEMEAFLNQHSKSTDPLIIIGSCFPMSLSTQHKTSKHIHLERLDYCFDLICPKEMVSSLINEGSYLASSGWLKNWRSTLADWGFDQMLAQQFFQKSAKKIVLLDTGIYTDSRAALESLATYVGLPFQHIQVGLEHFFWRLSSLVSSVRVEHLQQKQLLGEEKLSQYEFSLSLLNRLTDSQTEQKAITGLVEIFRTLFAPQYVSFHPHLQTPGDKNEDLHCEECLSTEKLLRLNKDNYLLHDSRDGFWFVLRSGDFVAGYLNIVNIQIVEHINRYLNLALAIAPVCALTISRGRFAEQRQKDINALQQKNEEIEQFVNVVSHDLKSPLVTVSSFLEMLQQDIGKNPELVATDVSFIRGGIVKMELLINALLQLARAGKNENTPQNISLQSLVNSSLAAVAGSVHRYGIDVVVKHEDIQLIGDSLQLGQIWQNLVENAIKYRGNHPEPRIDIGVDFSSNGPVFFVRDNGMGVDPQHAQRIFNLFSQLDTYSDGIGLGLTLVKKVVESYQGKIWVESGGLGQGCCFKFTLPGATSLSRENFG